MLNYCLLDFVAIPCLLYYQTVQVHRHFFLVNKFKTNGFTNKTTISVLSRLKIQSVTSFETSRALFEYYSNIIPTCLVKTCFVLHVRMVAYGFRKAMAMGNASYCLRTDSSGLPVQWISISSTSCVLLKTRQRPKADLMSAATACFLEAVWLHWPFFAASWIGELSLLGLWKSKWRTSVCRCLSHVWPSNLTACCSVDGRRTSGQRVWPMVKSEPFKTLRTLRGRDVFVKLKLVWALSQTLLLRTKQPMTNRTITIDNIIHLIVGWRI